MQMAGLTRRVRMGATVAAVYLVAQSGTAMAGELGAVAPQGQIILNPEPGFAYIVPQPRMHSGLADLAPAAGRASTAEDEVLQAGCPASDAWSVVVVRGNHGPETVHGHAVTIIPTDC